MGRHYGVPVLYSEEIVNTRSKKERKKKEKKGEMCHYILQPPAAIWYAFAEVLCLHTQSISVSCYLNLSRLEDKVTPTH